MFIRDKGRKAHSKMPCAAKAAEKARACLPALRQFMRKILVMAGRVLMAFTELNKRKTKGYHTRFQGASQEASGIKSSALIMINVLQSCRLREFAEITPENYSPYPRKAWQFGSASESPKKAGIVLFYAEGRLFSCLKQFPLRQHNPSKTRNILFSSPYIKSVKNSAEY